MNSPDIDIALHASMSDLDSVADEFEKTRVSSHRFTDDPFCALEGNCLLGGQYDDIYPIGVCGARLSLCRVDFGTTWRAHSTCSAIVTIPKMSFLDETSFKITNVG